VDKGETGVSDTSDERRAEQLQHEIEDIRDNLGGLVSELDHRRHEALNLGIQLRRHALPLAIAGIAVIGLASGAIALAMRRSRARGRLPARAARLGQALQRMVRHPERQAPPPPSLGLKLLAAAGAAAASVVGRRVAQRLLAERSGSAPRPRPS
jgi:hypothetical protein